MLFSYKMSLLLSKLIFGVGFASLGLAALLLDNNPSIFFYEYIFFGFLSLSIFLFELKKQVRL